MTGTATRDTRATTTIMDNLLQVSDNENDERMIIIIIIILCK